MEWHFYFIPKRGYTVSSAEAFFGLIRMSNIVVVELLSRAVIYSTARKNRSPQYIIIGRLLRQRAKLSHDRLDYLYFSDAGIIQLGRNRRKRKTIRNVLSVWQTINGGLQPRRHFHDKYFRRISIKSLDQLLKYKHSCYFTVNTRACVG